MQTKISKLSQFQLPTVDLQPLSPTV